MYFIKQDIGKNKKELKLIYIPERYHIYESQKKSNYKIFQEGITYLNHINYKIRDLHDEIDSLKGNNIIKNKIKTGIKDR